MGFVDDQEHKTSLAGEIGEGGTELRQELRKGVGRLGLESEKDLSVERSDGEAGIGEIDDVIDIVVEGVGKGAESGGLAGADPSTSSGQAVASDEGGEVLLESE